MLYFFRSFTVRSYWGQLMRDGTARRDFNDIQLHNVITLATRVRILILKVLNYKEFIKSLKPVLKLWQLYSLR